MNVQQQQPLEMSSPSYEQPDAYSPPPPVVPAPAPAPVPATVTSTAVGQSEGTGFGKMFGILGSAMGLLLGVALLIGSALLLFRKAKGVETEATIVSAVCKENSGDNSKSVYSCDLELKYKDAAEKEVVVKKTVDSNTYYSAGQKVTVYYSSDKPTEVELKASNQKTLGWILFAIGMVILVAAGIGMYFMLRTPSVAVSTVV